MQRKARFAKLKICVYKEEMPITPYERPLFNSLRFERSESEAKLFEHHCEVDVSFGPWEAVADVYDLLHCIVSDLADRGISADQQCIGVCDKHLINHYYCKRPIYEFKITWWWSVLAGTEIKVWASDVCCCLQLQWTSKIMESFSKWMEIWMTSFWIRWLLLWQLLFCFFMKLQFATQHFLYGQLSRFFSFCK